MTASARFLRVLFVAYVAATLVHVGWIMAHEPFTFDAWNIAVDTHGQPFSLGRFFDYWSFEYTHSNPRVGQALTYLAYKLEYFAVIATPLAFAAITLAIVVLALGRWPFRRGRDLALWAIVVGFCWFALPQLPKTMFCRAYGANYVYGAAIQLWFLVPLRLARDGLASRARCIAYGVFGVIAGMCNEHSGPTLCAFAVLYAWWTQRRTGARPMLLWAGAAGVVVGFAAIFFAPGQGERYEGLAQKASMLGRVAGKGFAGNLDILRELLLGAAPTLAAIAIVLIVALVRDPDDDARARLRGALRFIALALVASTLMAITLFVSPKLGTRFYLASCALILAGFIALADLVLTSPRRLVPFVVVALFASGYAVARTVPLYARAKADSDVRIAALVASQPGTVFVADAFEQVDDSWWFLGDDFRDTKKRAMVSDYFALAGIAFREYDMYAPLGVSSASFVPHAVLDPPGALDEHGGFKLGSFKGFDLDQIHRETKVTIALLQERLGATRLRALDLSVELDDPRVVLPRKRVLIARWRPDRFEGYVGQIQRPGMLSHRRDLVLPKELVGSDDEIYIYLVGGEAKRLGTAREAQLHYVPWRHGVYWALACGPDECFVIAATRQTS